MLDITCTNEEKVPVTVVPVTSQGKPATLDGALRVSVTEGDGTFTQDPATPLQFFAISGDGLGVTTYLVEADADLGEGVKLIQDTVTLTVGGALAANFGMTAGAPVAK